MTNEASFNPNILPDISNGRGEQHSILTGVILAAVAVAIGISYWLWNSTKSEVSVVPIERVTEENMTNMATAVRQPSQASPISSAELDSMAAHLQSSTQSPIPTGSQSSETVKNPAPTAGSQAQTSSQPRPSTDDMSGMSSMLKRISNR